MIDTLIDFFIAVAVVPLVFGFVFQFSLASIHAVCVYVGKHFQFVDGSIRLRDQDDVSDRGIH